jgi:hypothetical protein
MHRAKERELSEVQGGWRATWPYALFIFLLIPSLYWVLEDRTVWPWDQAWYGEVTVDLWFWCGRSISHWVGMMADGMNMKPPGLVWLAQIFVPLRAMLGSVEAALLSSILLIQFLILLVLFKIGRQISPVSHLTATAGVIFAAGSQLFVGLSHQFFVEPLQTLAVAWCFYVAIMSPTWGRPRILIHLTATVILGVLAKATTPIYCIVAIAYAMFQLRSQPTAPTASVKSKKVITAVVGLTCLAGVTSLWYVRHLPEVWRHVREASSGEIALSYGVQRSWLQQSKVWIGVFDQSFLNPYLLWVCAVALLALAAIVFLPILRQWRVTATWYTKAKTIALLSTLQLVVMLCIFSSTVIVEPRFIYGLLPVITILLMYACAVLPHRIVALVVLCCIIRWGLVNGVALGINGRLTNQSVWLLPAHMEQSQYHELMEAIKLTSDMPDRYDIIATEDAWLNANSAAFFAAKNRLNTGVRSYYTSLGYAQRDIGAAMRRIDEFRPRYILTLAEPLHRRLPAFLNEVSLPVLRRLQHDPRFSQVPFASHNGLIVFRLNTETGGS